MSKDSVGTGSVFFRAQFKTLEIRFVGEFPRVVVRIDVVYLLEEKGLGLLSVTEKRKPYFDTIPFLQTVACQCSGVIIKDRQRRARDLIGRSTDFYYLILGRNTGNWSEFILLKVNGRNSPDVKE